MAVGVELLLSNLDFLNNREARGSNTQRSIRFGRILMELTNLGSTAVPKIVERLDQTDDDRMIASLAFVLRAIGDKRGVPALIRAIPKTLLPSGCNWIERSQVTDKELDLFFRMNRFQGQGDAAIGCSNADTELHETLASLTGVKFPISRTYGSGTERQVYLQRQVLHNDARRWADWWNENSSRHVDDGAYAKVELSPFAMPQPDAVDPDQLLERLSWQYANQLSALQRANIAANGNYPTAFLDLDTGRCESKPLPWRDKQFSDPQRIELLAWAEKEGFDLYCDEVKADNGKVNYVLRGPGTQSWQIDDKLWDGASFEPHIMERDGESWQRGNGGSPGPQRQ